MNYKLSHISPVRTEKIFGSEFLNLRGAIVKIIHQIQLKIHTKTSKTLRQDITIF